MDGLSFIGKKWFFFSSALCYIVHKNPSLGAMGLVKLCRMLFFFPLEVFNDKQIEALASSWFTWQVFLPSPRSTNQKSIPCCWVSDSVLLKIKQRPPRTNRKMLDYVQNSARHQTDYQATLCPELVFELASHRCPRRKLLVPHSSLKNNTHTYI